MSDLIDRQEAIYSLEKGLSKIPYMNNTDEEMIRRDERIGCIQEVRALPSVQPRRGKWAGKGDSEGFGIFICDNCGKFAMMEFDFCPNCGADMRPQFEEPEINPCRGCEDYDGKGGCKTKGGCAESRGDSAEYSK